MATRRARVAIVPAHRAEKTIARTLHALFETTAGQLDDIIVVASPDDATAAVAEQLGVTVIRTRERRSAGAARNIGRDAARGADSLLFVDADCAPAPGAVAALDEAMRRDRLDAAGASIVSEPYTRVAWVRHALEFKDSEPGATVVRPGFVPSATILCDARAYDAIGGFPDLWPGEDLVFCARLLRFGYQVARVPEAVTLHAHPPGIGVMLRHQLALGATSARARRIEPLPGGEWSRRPWAAPLLFAGRFSRMIGWAARTSQLRKACSPLRAAGYTAGLAAWCAGFAREAAKADR